MYSNFLLSRRLNFINEISILKTFLGIDSYSEENSNYIFR